MANIVEKFGLRPYRKLDGTPLVGAQNRYIISANNTTAIYQGDLVIAETDGTITRHVANNSTAVIGVFNGCFFVNSTTSKPTFANSVAASTTFGTDYNTGSDDGLGFVNDNPFQEYETKADAAVTQAMYGDAGYNVNSFTASDAVSGQSTVTLDIGGGAASTHMFKLVRSANDPENKDNTATGSNQIVVIAGASNLYNGDN